MALQDVSKMITGLQKTCVFVEWFTRTFRGRLAEALAVAFRPDVPDGAEPPEVLPLVDTLVTRLRRILNQLTGTETVLLRALKHLGFLRVIRDDGTKTLRTEFARARGTCRDSYGPAKADEAGFPARIAFEPVPLLRQTDVVTSALDDPEFDLGDNLIAGSNVDKEKILNTFAPGARDLKQVMERIARATAETQGKQEAKDQAMKEFALTYRLFVDMIGTSFRLSGQPEMADRLTPPKQGRPGTLTDVPDIEQPEPEAAPDEVSQAGSSSADAAEMVAPPLPEEIAKLVRDESPADDDETD